MIFLIVYLMRWGQNAMFSKIDIRSIVADHYRTLISFKTKKFLFSDYFLFVGTPVIFSGIFYFYCLKIDSSAASVITTAVTILAGLLFNLLVLIHTVSNRNESYTTKKDTYIIFMEVYSNISYSIFVSLISLIPLIFLSIVTNDYSARIVSAIVIFLIIHLLLTLLMILKRIHFMLRLEFKP